MCCLQLLRTVGYYYCYRLGGGGLQILSLKKTACYTKPRIWNYIITTMKPRLGIVSRVVKGKIISVNIIKARGVVEVQDISNRGARWR